MKPFRFKSKRAAETPKPRPARSLAAFLYIVVLIQVVIFIAFNVMMKESLRLDEAQSIWQTSHSLGGTLAVVAEDVHMPMYHVLLHYWMILFGTGVEAVRSMSLLFFVLCIPVLYLLARTILNRSWSLVTVTLFALAPFMNWYGSEARMYTLLTLFALLSQYFYVRILQGKQGWGGYVITAILGAYSHYFFLFTLAAQAIFYLFNRKKFPAGSFKKFIFTAIAVVAGMAPWIYYFFVQGLASNTRPILPTPSTVDFFNVFSQFLFGFQTDAVNTIILSSWPVLVVLAFFTVKRRMKIDDTVFYLLAAGLVPIVLAFVLSFVTTPFFLGRYMMPAVAPLFLAAVWLISQYPKKLAYGIAAVWLAVLGGMFLLQMNSPQNPVRENYRSVAQDIERESTINDVVVLTSPFTVYPFEYYYDGPNQIRTLPAWDRQNAGPIPAFDENTLGREVDALRNGHDYIYLLASHDQGYQDSIVNYFKNRYEQTKEQDYSEDMTLHVFRVGYNAQPVIAPEAR